MLNNFPAVSSPGHGIEMPPEGGVDESHGDKSEAFLARARRDFHAALLANGVLTVNDKGVASNADGGQRSSVAFAKRIADSLLVETVGERLAGQTSGGEFETACADFVRSTFLRLGMLRPGEWSVTKVAGRRSIEYIAAYDQYSHLLDLDLAVKANPELRAVLGNAYVIAPDVVVVRAPVDDDFINSDELIVDESVARLASLRRVNQPRGLLHAVISCKWTLRSDRAQNARSESLNLIRNRKGRLPHIAVVTAEPSPSRLASLALGTGDVDTLYHFALPELIEAVHAEDNDEAISMLDTMVSGKRLKDIADLPLDLAI
ncbi:NgoMIV family type II restriction endonuclease [Agromyces sp. PvR057]|uniref:NgoMIV family type II restriction endonuclease n=1 Tax=Agromyces sp. PvR057 TaxID=3156403 RepID=UPI0033985A90